MAFKIKDGVRVGTIDVFNNAGTLLVPAPSWITPRTVTFGTGDSTGSFSIDGSADVSNVALTLNTLLTGVAASKINEPNVSYGSSSKIPVFTVDAKGRITAISEASASLEFTISGNTGTDLFTGGTVALTGSTGITTTIVGTNAVLTTATFALDSTAEVTFAGVTAGNVQIALGANNNTITTSAGDLTLLSASNIINLGANATDSVIIAGNLTVNGTTSTINSTTITVDDKNIELGSTAAPTDAGADGGGITLKGATDKTILWLDATDRWTFNQGIEATSIQNTPIGSTTRSSGAFTTLDANGNVILGDAVTDTITVNSQFVTGTQLRTAQAATNTLALAAYDVDGVAYTNLVTLTASNTPTLSLTSTGVGSINNMSIGATTASTGVFTQVTVNGSNLNTAISPTGTSTVTISPGGALTLGTAAVTTSLLGNVSAIGNAQTVVLSPTGAGTVTISPAGALTLGTAAASTSLLGNITATTAAQTISLSPTGAGTVTISPGGTLTLGTAAASTSILGNVSAITANQTVNLSPTGTGTVNVSPAGILTLGTSAVTTSLLGNLSATTSNQTVNLSPTGTGTVTISPVGALTINPTAASTINNTSIGATTASSGRFTTVITTTATNATNNATGSIQTDGGISVDLDIYHSGSHVHATAAGVAIAYDRALQTTVATTATTPLDSWAVASFRYATYIVQITQGVNTSISEVRVAHNGTTTTMTEFAVLEPNSAVLAPAFTSDINTGNVRLLVTMTSAASATVNILRTLMVV